MNKLDAEEEYYRIIGESFDRKTGDSVCEKHHILPKSIFPEYVKDSGNIALLTCHEHILAHYYLCFIYPCDKTKRMFHKMTGGRIDINDEDSELRLMMILPDISKYREEAIIKNYVSQKKEHEIKFEGRKKEKLRKRMTVTNYRRKKKIRIKSLAAFNK